MEEHVTQALPDDGRGRAGLVVTRIARVVFDRAVGEVEAVRVDGVRDSLETVRHRGLVERSHLSRTGHLSPYHRGLHLHEVVVEGVLRVTTDFVDDADAVVVIGDLREVFKGLHGTRDTARGQRVGQGHTDIAVDDEGVVIDRDGSKGLPRVLLGREVRQGRLVNDDHVLLAGLVVEHTNLARIDGDDVTLARVADDAVEERVVRDVEAKHVHELRGRPWASTACRGEIAIHCRFDLRHQAHRCVLLGDPANHRRDSSRDQWHYERVQTSDTSAASLNMLPFGS